MKKRSQIRSRRVAPRKTAAFSLSTSGISELTSDVGRISVDVSDLEDTSRAILEQLVVLTEAVRALSTPRGKRRG